MAEQEGLLSIISYSWDIQGSAHVYRLIPFPRKLVPSGRVPPILVELPVGEARHLSAEGFDMPQTAHNDSSANPVQTHSKMML